jgi:hypothetical protein
VERIEKGGIDREARKARQVSIVCACTVATVGVTYCICTLESVVCRYMTYKVATGMLWPAAVLKYILVQSLALLTLQV